MKSGWYVLAALSISGGVGAAGPAKADALSNVSIQAVGPIGTQNDSGAMAAHTSLSFGQNLNKITATIGKIEGLARTDIPQGQGSLIFDTIRMSTQVTLTDPNFPNCGSPTFGAACNFQAGFLDLFLAGISSGSGRVGASAHGSTGLNGSGVVIPFGIDFNDGGPTGPFNPPFGPGNLLGSTTLFMPSGTYFVNIQFNVSVFGVGFVDFSNSFHAFVEVADGVTFSEVTGLLPLGPPVSSVPLPDTYALMVGGLGLLGFVARSKKQQAAY